MIHVVEQPEPHDFHSKVRIPGEAFLRRNPNPKSNQFERCWSDCLSDLYTSYNGICAYTASILASSERSVDHYVPKQKAKHLAYEWSNYRLCLPRVNGHKKNSEDVIDPFHIQNGWFNIDFTSFFIFPADELPEYLTVAIIATITQLKLNSDDILVRARRSAVVEYVKNNLPFEDIERYHPFLAFELDRQGLRHQIKSILTP